MSIAALTTVAAARDLGTPIKQDAGKATRNSPPVPASMTDLLITQVPTELVAPYTAVTAGLVGAVAKASSANMHPDQLTGWRWLALAILLVGTFGLTWEGKVRKAPGGAFPLLEITGALIAATGWAFALPASPLSPYLHGTAAQTATPLVVAFAAIVASSITAGALQSPRKSAPGQPAPAGSADGGASTA
jgi:hypothetical protein